MKNNAYLSFIPFYLISVFSLILLIIGFSSPISSLIVLIVFSISLYFGSFYLQKNIDNQSALIMKYTFVALFVVYIFYILSLLFTNTYFGRDQVLETRVNLIPFKTITLFLTSANEHTLPLSSIITNLLGNLIAFMPLGFYLPLFFKHFKKWYVYLPCVIVIIGIIEALQLLLKCGSCDVDDLILNVIGAVIFYFILKNKKITPIIKKIIKF